jgi:hypothetical protein
MTVAVKMVNDTIKMISDTNSLFDMLLQFEKVLAEIDLYAFRNWFKGEILEGPTLKRHYVIVKLLYRIDEMPDPAGAKRLMARGCLVSYEKDTLITPRKVKGYSDIDIETRPDGTNKYRAKPQSDPVWVVTIEMPRRYVDEFITDVVEADADSYVDTESLNTETEMDQDEQLGGFEAGMDGGGDDFGFEDELGGF